MSNALLHGSFRQKVVDFLDLSLLKDIVYLNMVIGIALSLYSDGTFYTLLPMYLFELGFSKVINIGCRILALNGDRFILNRVMQLRWWRVDSSLTLVPVYFWPLSVTTFHSKLDMST